MDAFVVRTPRAFTNPSPEEFLVPSEKQRCIFPFTLALGPYGPAGSFFPRFSPGSCLRPRMMSNGGLYPRPGKAHSMHDE